MLYISMIHTHHATWFHKLALRWPCIQVLRLPNVAELVWGDSKSATDVTAPQSGIRYLELYTFSYPSVISNQPAFL